jgi:Zn-dependent protease with chaperone function
VDFFTQQERSRRATRLLIVLFLLAVAGTVAAVTIAAGLAINLYRQPYDPGGAVAGSFSAWIADNNLALLMVAALTAGLIGLASLYRSASLSRGGGEVARLLGATELSGEIDDPLRRRLMNIVEEMAIASGIPVPEVFVLEQEQGINAFAAGLNPANAAVAVTRGALERLTRSELQGVVAHEFSHILNGDMRLNQQLMGLSFGILVLSLMGKWLLRSLRVRRRGRSSGAMVAAMALGAMLVIIGSIGLFFSRLIKAGVARQRETLADASAVQFTRDVSGLAGALKKIGGHTGQLVARNGEEVAHMLFSRGSLVFRGWFATHPPLDERIRLLDPTFEPGDYTAIEVAEAEESLRAVERATRASLADETAQVSAAQLLEQAGHIAPQTFAAALRRSIPEEIGHAAHSKEVSFLLILALGLSRENSARMRQLEFLDLKLGSSRTSRCRALAAELDALDGRFRLPVLELAMPALKARPPEQLGFLTDLLRRLGELSETENLFDYVLMRVLESYLRLTPAAEIDIGHRQGRISVGEAFSTLLRAVAAFGHDDAGAALAAFKAGMSAVTHTGGAVAEPRFVPLSEARALGTLDAALLRLAAARPKAKRAVLKGVLACIRHDRELRIEELELFRAVAATLECPMPPASAVTADV